MEIPPCGGISSTCANPEADTCSTSIHIGILVSSPATTPVDNSHTYPRNMFSSVSGARGEVVITIYLLYLVLVALYMPIYGKNALRRFLQRACLCSGEQSQALEQVYAHPPLGQLVSLQFLLSSIYALLCRTRSVGGNCPPKPLLSPLAK
jgi:hypothetical protein